MIVSVDMVTTIVFAVVLLALHPIGHWEGMGIGLVIMDLMAMIVAMTVVLVVLVVFLVIEESHHMAILVALLPMLKGLVGDIVAVV